MCSNIIGDRVFGDAVIDSGIGSVIRVFFNRVGVSNAYDGRDDAAVICNTVDTDVAFAPVGGLC